MAAPSTPGRFDWLKVVDISEDTEFTRQMHTEIAAAREEARRGEADEPHIVEWVAAHDGGHLMSDKQQLQKFVEAIPEGATWDEITDQFLATLAQHSSPAVLARLYRTRLTAADLAEYLDPKFEFSLADVVAELKAMPVEAK